jgi:signal transduction histidine kinase
VKVDHEARQETLASHGRREAEIGLPHRLFPLIRGLCFVLIALTLIFFIATLPAYTVQMQTICQTASCAQGQLTPKTAHNLQNFGFSVLGYVILNVTLTIVSACVWFAISALLLWRKSDNGMALLVATMLVMLGVYGGQGNIGLNTLAGSSSMWQFSAQLLNYFSYLALYLVISLFPSGQFVPRWMRWVVIVVVLDFASHDLLSDWPFTLNPWIYPLKDFLFIGCVLTGIGSQIYRYFRLASVTQRLQTKWVVFSLLIFTVFTLLAYYVPALFIPALQLGSISSLYRLGLSLASTLTLLVIPISFGISLLRYRLWDIDILINRSLVYGLLTACIVGLYALVVGALSSLLQVQGNFLVSLLGAGLVAVLFHPLRERLQRMVNRLLYGQRDEPYRVISHLGSRLEATLAPERVLPTIVETTAHALKLPYVAITLKQEGDLVLAAATGMLTEGLLHLPLRYQTEQLGELQLAPRAPGEPLSPKDRHLLEDLARHAGMAVYAVRMTNELQQLTDELQRSRVQLVTAREEERRRLRRDLHDGLGSMLSSLNLRSGAIRAVLTRDVPAAQSLLKEQQSTIRSAIADIRRLVYALRPPSLDELGLIGALREQAAHYMAPMGAGLQVTIEAPGELPPLPAATEVAAYRIVQEALVNVERHAQARSCCVQLTMAQAVLKVEITDDGVGVSSEPHIGIGLQSMRERAAELSGSFQIQPGPEGGTRVSVTLPLTME